ncbi:hypothetical protein ACH47Z_43180 [Streptomyces sp. NPDC020192]|uniref:hypothetical protein n=1 Tax=Streptomyces sp. NPDC020192 TaxID=3365066 RepID=UPI0037A73EFD
MLSPSRKRATRWGVSRTILPAPLGGAAALTASQAAAQTAVEHHVQNAADHGCPHPTISDRASVMAAARREQLLDDLEAAVGERW